MVFSGTALLITGMKVTHLALTGFVFFTDLGVDIRNCGLSTSLKETKVIVIIVSEQICVTEFQLRHGNNPDCKVLVELVH